MVIGADTYGIYQTAAGNRIRILGCYIAGTGNIGISITTIDDCVIDANVVVMSVANKNGIQIGSGAENVVATANRISGYSGTGVGIKSYGSSCWMGGDLLEQGLELMLAGMGTVFVFLTLLVFATSAMSALVRRFEPAPMAPSADVSEEEVAAITAAVTLHRSKQSG